jgi:hypothetical protein
MKLERSIAIVLILGVLCLNGCTVSPVYVMEQERIDQNMKEGNRGYLQGEPPPAPDRSGLKRSFLAVDVELERMTDDEKGEMKRKAYLEPARASKRETPTETKPQAKPVKKRVQKKVDTRKNIK